MPKIIFTPKKTAFKPKIILTPKTKPQLQLSPKPSVPWKKLKYTA